MPDEPWDKSHEIDPKHPRYSDLIHIYNNNDPEIHRISRDFRKLFNKHGDILGIPEIYIDLNDWVKYYGKNHDEF